jgi:hypothetical protein
MGTVVAATAALSAALRLGAGGPPLAASRE